MAISKILLGVAIIFLQAGFALAEDAATTKALTQTQDLLRDSTMRQKAGAESSKAAATMKSAENFVGKENTDEFYDLSAEIMGTITNQNHGDVKSMTDSLNKSPEQFFEFLTPEEIARIKALAKKIEGQRAPSSKPN